MVVVALVPLGEALEVFLEGVEQRHEVGVDDAIDVLHVDACRLRHLAPEGVHDAVVDVLPPFLPGQVLRSLRNLVEP